MKKSCARCDNIKKDTIRHKGYVYVCKCGHFSGLDIKDFPDWQTRYSYHVGCHECRTIFRENLYTERLYYTDIDYAYDFILEGAL